MSALIICPFDSGGSSNVGASEGDASTGTFSFSNSVTCGSWSRYSLRCNPTTTNTGGIRIGLHAASNGTASFPGSGGAATGYYQFKFRVATLPAANNEEFSGIYNVSGGLKITFRINSSGNISAYRSGTVLITTGTAVLSTDTWYTIQIKVGTGSTNVVVEWKIDGVTDVSTTSSSLTGNNGAMFVGKYTNRNNQTVDFYYDDAILDDADYPSLNTRIGILLPNGAGNYQNFTRGGADSGSNYGQVDEIPINDNTDYLLSTLNTSHKETEAFEPSTTLSLSNTILAVQGIACVVNDDASNGGSYKLILRSGSTDDILASVGNPASQANGYIARGKVYTTDPATSLAWTTSGIDGVEFGLQEQNTLYKTRISLIYLRVAWIPDAVIAANIRPKIINYKLKRVN